MSQTPIRYAKEADLPQIIQLCKAHAAFEQTTYEEQGKAEGLKEAMFGVAPHLFCLVAVDGDKILGYATFMKQYGTWGAAFYTYLDCLFLLEEARGFGIGERMIDLIKERSRAWGCGHMQWQTPDFNERAIKFYRRLGATSKSKERFRLEI